MTDPAGGMVLAVVMTNAGAHPGGWRHAGAEHDMHDIGFYARAAQAAERGKLDAFFIADAQGFRHLSGRDAYAATDSSGRLEPLTMLSALAMVTERIGLVATCSTTYNEPYSLARRFASLDHISNGRAGWNVVTSQTDNEARNFGRDANMAHDNRYARAEEFVDVAFRLWDSWEAGADLGDKAQARFFDPDKVHALEHQGPHFSVAGPLNVGRSPQGRPVIFQAGASGPGKALAVRTADAIFTAQSTLESAQTFYRDIKQAAAVIGRPPEQVKVLPSVQLLVRGTDAEARAAEIELRELISPALALSHLEMLLGDYDLSAFPIDGPLPEIPASNGSQWVQQRIIAMARDEQLSIAEVARRASVSRASKAMAGTPEQIADMLESWFRGGGGDGFALSPPYLPDGIDGFVDGVVPILRKRGLFREEYTGTTLRAHLGLPEPENSFAAHPELHREPAFWQRAKSIA